MAMKSLPQLRSLFKEPQLMHKWQIEIPTWPAAAKPANPDVLFFVTTSSIPKPEVTDAEVELGGFKLICNGKEVRAGEIEWSFFENVDQTITRYFLIDYPNARQNHKSSSDISLKSANEMDLIAPIINMNLFDASGEKVTATYQLINAKFKVSDIGGGELGQEASVAKHGITVTYDSFIVKAN